MYMTSGPEPPSTASDIRPLESASEYTTSRVSASLTDNHEIIGNDVDM